jgi:hypothetical protein
MLRPKSSLLTHRALTVVLACAVLLTSACDNWAAAASTKKANQMKSLNCTVVKLADFERALADAKARRIYKAAAKLPTAEVRFEMRIPGIQAASEALSFMVVHSARLEVPVYAGPYTDQFSVVVDNKLTSDNGTDSLRFEFYRTALNQICFWEQERVESYWQAGSTVKIQFLESRRIDERTGNSIAFVVQIAPKPLQSPR